jgi:hypothetical protein
MVSLTPEQIEYKERTLNQLLLNQTRLEAGLNQETRPEVIKDVEEQLRDIEEHINRLQDELAGNVVFDEPVGDELFLQAVKALAKEKFYLAKKHIHRLETIEPFYPGLARLSQEAEAGRVSRRTRSIAQGTATSYPNTPSLRPATQLRPSEATGEKQLAAPGIYVADDRDERKGWFAHWFQFHIVISCLVIGLVICLMLGIGGVTLLQWLIER